jgi:hypothetical protein
VAELTFGAVEGELEYRYVACDDTYSRADLDAALVLN